uniref:Uncharacterized protein n=1 Tax=Myotis myotis TaxID=51298 RepID=A0A7J7TTS9_MYOMY|nr:hypothetical protein mMyoMyo1_008967 [Myotis myotis]
MIQLTTIEHENMAQEDTRQGVCEAHAAGLKQSYPVDLQTHEQENQHLLWKIHCLKSDGSRTHQMVQDSSCDCGR